MKKEKQICCASEKDSRNGILSGMIVGFFPHIPCIAFVAFSAIGAVVATSFVGNILLIPNIFSILIGVSILFAIFSATLYLRKKKCLCVSGVCREWKYLSVLFGTTVSVNFLMFFVVFPAVAGMNFKGEGETVSTLSNEKKSFFALALSVNIPCSGHAPLIKSEVEKIDGVVSVRFVPQNNFIVEYDSARTDSKKVLDADVFKEFPVTINHDSALLGA